MDCLGCYRGRSGRRRDVYEPERDHRGPEGSARALRRPAGPSAKLELVEPATYEFGTMSQLSAGKHTWEIKNVGDADLELRLGRTTCSCTVAKLKSADGRGKTEARGQTQRVDQDRRRVADEDISRRVQQGSHIGNERPRPSFRLDQRPWEGSSAGDRRSRREDQFRLRVQ